MSEAEALARVRVILGTDKATVQCCNWFMPETKTYCTLYYAWLNGVIRATGGDWDDLVGQTKKMEDERLARLAGTTHAA